MLGAMVARVLDASEGVEVSVAARRGGDEVIEFDAARDSVSELLAADEYAWIVNAIGVIKPRIDERDPASVARAIEVNAAFPHRLAAALRPGQRVIQIATDGVFSGAAGPYDESAPPDGGGVYARSKSLGETTAPGFVTLRCSIVGPEGDPPASLLGWALGQPRGAGITGYTNQRWNGVTTLHFARLCAALIEGKVDEVPSPQHVVPADAVTKAELLELALAAFDRSDVVVERAPAEAASDSTLSTTRPEANRRLWAAAGYPEPPTISAMLTELAASGQLS